MKLKIGKWPSCLHEETHLNPAGEGEKSQAKTDPVLGIAGEGQGVGRVLAQWLARS